MYIALDTPFDSCSTGDVRIVPDYYNSGTSQDGRLELCINNAWGTICDSRFDNKEAAIACSSVIGFSRQGMYY